MTSGHTARASPPVAGRRHNPVIDLPVAVGPPGPAARYVRRRRRWKPGPRAPLGDVPLRILRFPGNERACPSGRQRRMTKTFARPTRRTPHDLGREIRPQQQRPLLRRPTNVSCRNDCRSSDGDLTVAKHNTTITGRTAHSLEMQIGAAALSRRLGHILAMVRVLHSGFIVGSATVRKYAG